jgi:hypothetical protein
VDSFDRSYASFTLVGVVYSFMLVSITIVTAVKMVRNNGFPIGYYFQIASNSYECVWISI